MTAAKLAEYRKVLVYIAGVLASALATGLLPSNVAQIVSAVLAVLTGIGVYRVPNKPTTPPVPPPAPRHAA